MILLLSTYLCPHYHQIASKQRISKSKFVIALPIHPLCHNAHHKSSSDMHSDDEGLFSRAALNAITARESPSLSSSALSSAWSPSYSYYSGDDKHESVVVEMLEPPMRESKEMLRLKETIVMGKRHVR